MSKKLIVANWKMNPTKGSEAAKMFKAINKSAESLKNVETVVCPPLVYLESLGQLVTTRSCVLGAQDAFWEHEGAYTGQVSPDMVFNAKARYVIVGHSERRAMGDTDDIVQKKLTSILQFPLIPIVCVGESHRDDDSAYLKDLKIQLGQSLGHLAAEQLSRIVIAYEPVWAIGVTAKRPCEPAECREAIGGIRQVLADMFGDTQKAGNITILYGGSVNGENAGAFLAEGNVNGLLIGRTSLDPKAFAGILKIAEKQA